MIYSLCLLLILVGLYGVVAGRQTVKIVISLVIMQHGVHLLLLLIGYRVHRHRAGRAGVDGGLVCALI